MKSIFCIIICAGTMLGTVFSVLCVCAHPVLSDTIKVHKSKVVKRAVLKTTKTAPARADLTNVKFYHSYTREIDLKAPKNQVFATPGNTLFTALLNGIKQQKITAYTDLASPQDVNDRPFTKPLSYAQVSARINSTVTVDKFDKDGNKIGTKKVVDPFNPDNIAAYRIKELVYLDKQTKKVETQIIGLAPLTVVRLSNGDTIGVQPVCWLKYEQCRPVMALLNVAGPDKDAPKVNIGSAFSDRQFDARITEESNLKGERIKDYIADPKEQDKESARIEKKLADYKSNPGN